MNWPHCTTYFFLCHPCGAFNAAPGTLSQRQISHTSQKKSDFYKTDVQHKAHISSMPQFLMWFFPHVAAGADSRITGRNIMGPW